MRSSLFKFLVVPACSLMLALPSFAARGVEGQQDSSQSLKGCKAAVLMEHSSGESLFEHNIHEPLPPASMVKMLVAYVVMKKVQEGWLKLSDKVIVSSLASKIGGSQVYLKQGEEFTVGQLLEAVLIQSANDAAVALAEQIGGSPEGFVEFMNQEAKNLGMNESEFHTPHGLPPAKDQLPDLASAHDLAILGRALIRDFPQLLEYTGKSEGFFRDGTFIMRNHNHLVRNYVGCDGLKTGFYAKAGFGVTATAQRNGVRMLAVVMGCEQRKARESETARLLSMGFARYRAVKLLDKGSPLDQMVRVIGGKRREVVPVTGQEVIGVLKSGEEKEVSRRYELCPALTAPVAQGTACGSVAFMVGEREVARVPVLVGEDVAELGFLGKIFRKVTG